MALSLGSTTSSFVTVWDTTLGAGSYSMDGLRVEFAAQSVVAVRLTATGGGMFMGWDEVVFHFGQTVSSGSVKVAASGVLEAVSGESLSVSSESVSVSAGRTLDVSGGESVTVSTKSVDILAEDDFSLIAGSFAAAVAESIEVISGKAMQVTAQTLSLSAYGDIKLASGGLVSLSGDSASIVIEDDLKASAQNMDLLAGGMISAMAREKISVTTESLTLNTESIEAYADESAKLVTGKASLRAKTLKTFSETLDIKASKSLKFNAVQDVKVEGQELSFGGGAGRVRLSSAPKIATAEFDVGADAAEDPDAILAEMAELLGVPVSRLRMEQVDDDAGR